MHVYELGGNTINHSSSQNCGKNSPDKEIIFHIHVFLHENKDTHRCRLNKTAIKGTRSCRDNP